MIQILDKAIKPPVDLTNQTSKNQINKAFINQDGKKCTNYVKVYEELKAISLHKKKAHPDESGKCFFCESKAEHASKLQVEHYRPKAKVDKKDTGGAEHKGYYWLANEWTNLLLACDTCNKAKGNRFPIASKRASAFNPVKNNKLYRTHCKANNSTLKNEIPILLNPEIDNPENFLTFDNDGHIKEIPDSYSRGKVTIDILKLNRGTLQQNRQQVLNKYKNELNVVKQVYDIGKLPATGLEKFLAAICKKIKESTQPQEEYSLWRKFINNSFEDCIVNNYDGDFRAKLVAAYNNI